MTSDMSQSNSEPRAFYTLLEFTMSPGFLYSVAIAQFCSSAREAAERSAGFQLGDGSMPRRILVYDGEPTKFEWIQVKPYILEIGKELR